MEYKQYIQINEPILLSSQTAIKELQICRLRKEAIQKKQSEQSKLEQELVLIDNQWKAFAERIEVLTRHEEASTFRVSIDEWKSLDKVRTTSTEDSLKNQELLSLANIKKDQAITSASSLVKKELNAETFISELELFRKEVESLLQIELTTDFEVKSAKSIAQRIVERIHQAGNSAFEVENTPDQAKAIISSIDEDFIEEGLTIDSDLQQELQQFNTKIDQIRNLFLAREGYESAEKSHAEALLQLKNEEAKIQLTTEQLNNANSKLEIQVPELEALEKEVEKLKLQRGLEEHRLHLIDGEPCPLCGATDHPIVKELQEQVEGEKEKLLKSKIDLVNSLRTLKIQSESTIQTLESVISNQKEELSRKAQALSNSLEQLKTLCEQLGWQSTDDVEIWRVEKSKIELRSKKFLLLESKRTLRKELLDFISQKEQLDKVEVLLSEAISKRKSRYNGLDLSRDVQNAISSFQSAQTECNQLSQRIKELSNTIQTANKDILLLESNLIPQMNAKGFTTLQDLFASLLNDADADAIRKHREMLSRKDSELKGSVKQLVSELDELKQQDDSSLSFDDLLSKINEVNDSIIAMNTGIIEAKKILEEDAKRQVYFAELKLERNAVKKDVSLWKKLNSLIGDAKGNKFANYVQELTLEQLIHYANGHLKGLTDRYQLMSPDKDNLRVADLHLGGTLRDVVTLSGGETFKLSLAMAFALSDLASQNVNIDTLFIDEGFGSLDPDSLNDAIGVLEDIQSRGSKSIGIISHVGELKERISAKIKLQPTGTGYSDLQIVNE